MSPKIRARIVRPTALMYCEGEHDLIFIRLLKSYYASDDPPSRPRITVKKGRGGSAFGLVEDAARLEGFDRRLVKLDNDRNSKEVAKAKAIAEKRGIALAITTPCLESLLLAILQLGEDFSGWSSERCKREFETKYIPKDKRTTPEAYPRHLTKAKIENIFISNGVNKVEVKASGAGEIVQLTGIAEAQIGETIADDLNPETLPVLEVEAPTLKIYLGPNTSPAKGLEGKFSTGRQIGERLKKELETNVGLRVKEENIGFLVSGRGELHLSVLIESLRREGYEYGVGRPQVVTRLEDGKTLEPRAYILQGIQ